MTIPSVRSTRRLVGAFFFCALLLGLVRVSAETPRTPPMLANQPIGDFKARRQKVMENVRDGIVVMIGAVEESNGVDAKFRQNNDFLYLTGADLPGASLILVPDGYQGAKEWLFLPPRNAFQERWTGPQLGPGEETAKLFNVERVVSTEDFDKTLKELLTEDFFTKNKAVYTIDFGQAGRLTRERLFTDELHKTYPKLRVTDLRPLLGEMRKIKTPGEIALLQKAVDITGEAHRDVLRAVKPGLYEYELEALILAAFFRNGAERPGFPCIVGSGEFSTVLHYNRNKRQIAAGELVVVDIGAEYSQYTADITRTLPASGTYSPRQREIYQLVLDAQEAAVKAFKPGETTMQALNFAAREFMKQSPLRAGNNLTMDNFFIHGLGHYVGMNVHDVGDYAKPLPSGAVITIEPGIYISSEKLGVRIEDDYLVTDKGLVKLSKNIPSRPEEIERLLAEARGTRPAASRK